MANKTVDIKVDQSHPEHWVVTNKAQGALIIPPLILTVTVKGTWFRPSTTKIYNVRPTGLGVYNKNNELRKIDYCEEETGREINLSKTDISLLNWIRIHQPEIYQLATQEIQDQFDSVISDAKKIQKVEYVNK